MWRQEDKHCCTPPGTWRLPEARQLCCGVTGHWRGWLWEGESSGVPVSWASGTRHRVSLFSSPSAWTPSSGSLQKGPAAGWSPQGELQRDPRCPHWCCAIAGEIPGCTGEALHTQKVCMKSDMTASAGGKGTIMLGWVIMLLQFICRSIQKWVSNDDKNRTDRTG